MISDEQLLWYYYGDGLSEEERKQIAQALQTDEYLAARFRDLQADLAALAPDTTAAAPEASKQRWHQLIEDAASAPDAPSHRSYRFAPWTWSAGLAAAVILGIGIGLQLDSPESSQPGSPASTPVAAAEDPPSIAEEPPATEGQHGAFRRGLQVHMQSAGLQLASLPELPNARRSELIDEMVIQNRLFIKAAQLNGAPEFARLLRAFEPILLQLRDTGETPTELDSLQRQLQFEFRAMLTQIEKDPSKQV